MRAFRDLFDDEVPALSERVFGSLPAAEAVSRLR